MFCKRRQTLYKVKKLLLTNSKVKKKKEIEEMRRYESEDACQLVEHNVSVARRPDSLACGM